MAVETWKEEWMRWIQGPGYRIGVIEGVDDLDPLDDNVDLEVLFDNGRGYGATFFTVENVRTLMEKDAETRGYEEPYVWAPYMVIVRDHRPETIAETVAAFIREEKLDQAFVRYADA